MAWEDTTLFTMTLSCILAWQRFSYIWQPFHKVTLLSITLLRKVSCNFDMNVYYFCLFCYACFSIDFFSIFTHRDVTHVNLYNLIWLTCRMPLTVTYTQFPIGGRTVFPWVGAGVQPKRGSALLWFNMDRAGKPDSRLQHGACPVLLGDKWGERFHVTFSQGC